MISMCTLCVDVHWNSETVRHTDGFIEVVKTVSFVVCDAVTDTQQRSVPFECFDNLRFK